MPRSVATLKIGLRKRCSGMTGSAARFSAAKNSTQATTAPMPSPMTSGSDHSYCVPPQLANSTVQVTAAAISAVPR